METIVQKRASLASIIQRSLEDDYAVVASPDHPLVLRSVDVLVGGPSGLTAIMMASAEELRRPQLFEARLTLNRMALAPDTSFIHLWTPDEGTSRPVEAFSEILELKARETPKDIVKLIRDRKSRSEPTWMDEIQRMAEPRFANTYRLARLLKRRSKELQSYARRPTNRMPRRDISSGIDGAYFDGSPSPAALSVFTTSECDRWFLQDNGQLYLTGEPAGVVYADSIPQYPGDPNKGLRAAAFAGWVISSRNTNASPEEINELVSRFTRPQ